MEGRWKTVQNQFKHMKKDQFLIFLLVGILTVVIFLPTSSDSEKEPEKQEVITKERQTKDIQEERLKEILSQVKGVGENRSNDHLSFFRRKNCGERCTGHRQNRHGRRRTRGKQQYGGAGNERRDDL